jgi:hypothetical protein
MEFEMTTKIRFKKEAMLLKTEEIYQKPIFKKENTVLKSFLSVFWAYLVQFS